MSNPFLTIVTPTYNRADLVPICFSALCAQTDFDFEWLIVDDGSEDNTEDVVKKFDESKFKIHYIKKENGGKHTALNASHPYINGKYVLILDSDDTLTANAVEQIKAEWTKRELNEEIGVVVFLRGSNSNRTPFCVVEKYDVPVDNMRCKRTCVIGDDCCEVIRSDLFKKYPFPVFSNERFLPEGVLWGRVSSEYKCVYINKVIYLCEYIDGGLTKLGRILRISNPLGGMCNANVYMTKKSSLRTRLKNGLLYTCYSFFAKKRISDTIREAKSKFLTVCCFPFGWLLYRVWKKKYELLRK